MPGHNEYFEMPKIYFQSVTTRQDEIVHKRLVGCHAFREQFVTYAVMRDRMAQHGTTWLNLCVTLLS